MNLIHTFTTLFSKRVSSRLVLSYMKEEAGELDFCDGHSPAVTITFVCPSERREVSGLPRRASWQRASVGTGRASTSRGGPGRRVRGQETAGREKMHQWNIWEDAPVGTDSRLHVRGSQGDNGLVFAFSRQPWRGLCVCRRRMAC